MKKVLAIALFAFVSASAFADYVEPNITHEPYGQQKVVYQINTSNVDMQIQILRNINNHINAVGMGDIDLKVTVFAAGMTLLETSKTEIVNAVENLRLQGVDFKVCNNTLKARNVDWRTLKGVEETDIVPAGVAELVYLQQKGYHYIRP